MKHSRTADWRYAAAPLLAVFLAAPLPAAAAPSGTLSMQFDGYAHGLIVLKMNGSLALTNSGYSGRLTLRTVGLVNLFSHMDSDSQARGYFRGDDVAPEQFDSTGITRGAARAMHIAYTAGAPHITQQEPPVDETRTPVPPQDTAGSIDTLSAIALLMHRAAEHGTCDGAVHMFDGRRLTDLKAHTAGQDTPSPSQKTKFNGPALRCDFDGVRLAGFARADDEAQQRLPRHGTAWLAPVVAGAPPVPVRVAFQNKVLGQVTLYLTDASFSPSPVAQNAGGAGAVR
jgi:hypothetical protein